MKKGLMKTLAVAAAAVVLGVGLSGCTSVGAQSDMIGIVVGDGTNNDAQVRDIVYPGEQRTLTNGDEVFYFPSNSRNYVIENRDSGAVDRKEPSVGVTSSKVPVNVELTAFWTINQDKDFLETKFWSYCKKYECATSDPNIRNERSATDGWVAMLDNDLSPAIDKTVEKVIPEFDDTIWKDRAHWDEIAARLSEEFNAQMRVRTGFTEDVYCGSGDSSFWADGKTGEGTFTCGPVRFQITSITAKDATVQGGADSQGSQQSQIEQNNALREAAEAKYGEKGGDYLAFLDLIEKCQKSSSCSVVISGDGNVVVTPNETAPAE